MDLLQLDGLYETDRSLKLEYIQINHNHIALLIDVLKATLILQSKVGLGRTFDGRGFGGTPPKIDKKYKNQFFQLKKEIYFLKKG